jgi:hypothetical protein
MNLTHTIPALPGEWGHFSKMMHFGDILTPLHGRLESHLEMRIDG